MSAVRNFPRRRLLGLAAILTSLVAFGLWLRSQNDSQLANSAGTSSVLDNNGAVSEIFASRILEASITMPGRSFRAERALRHLRDLCALGPRVSGSEAMKKQQDLLRKHFEQHGALVELQQFQAQQRSRREPVTMTNLIARWHPHRHRRILLCTHYDTRPIADQEPDGRLWHKPFLGANDGASGVALMMELAHLMPNLPAQLGVDFVCFDGEEYIFDNRPSDQGGDRYFFGSEYFAQQYARLQLQSPPPFTYVEAILVDMIAGKNPRFFIEQYSLVQAGPLVEKIWHYAKTLDCRAFIPEAKYAVLDDHLELLKVGIPAVDIIDFDYPHWHRLSDTPENCSTEGLEQVGRVLLLWMLRAQ